MRPPNGLRFSRAPARTRPIDRENGFQKTNDLEAPAGASAASACSAATRVLLYRDTSCYLDPVDIPDVRALQIEIARMGSSSSASKAH